MLTAIEKARELIATTEWLRSIQNFPKDTTLNCWGFALDNLKVPALERLTWYSDIENLEDKIFNFFQDVGLSPRKISDAKEKFPDEFVCLFYIFHYEYSNLAREIWETRSECHVARIEQDGTVVEKADSTEEPVITSLKGIQKRLLDEYGMVVNPILIAIRKPC